MKEDLGRMSLVLSERDMARIRRTGAGIAVDLHRLDRRNAMKLLNNIINLAKHSGRIDAIHGYRHGTAIMESVRNEFHNRKVRTIQACPTNPGITYLQVAW